MNEKDWLECGSVEVMLEFLRGTASDRKLRLFAVACARRVSDLATDKQALDSIEFAERYADGRATDKELRGHARGSPAGGGFELLWNAWDAASCAADYSIATKAKAAAAAHSEISKNWEAVFRAELSQGNSPSESIRAADATAPQTWLALRESARAEEQRFLCGLLRDILGPISFRSFYLKPTWHTASVLDLAESIYEAQSFSRFPILGDALEDAGCNLPEIMSHCRESREHVRGCWVLDLILRKT